MPENPLADLRVLLVESDATMRRSVRELLEREGLVVSTPAGIPEAVEGARDGRFDLALVAVGGSDAGIESGLRLLREGAPGLPVLVMLDPAEIRRASRALLAGAEDYMLRPPESVELRARALRILERRDLDSRVAFFQEEQAKKAELRNPEVRSPAMRGVLDRVTRVAPMRSTVLIVGESGVGKELVARSIHFDSPRRSEPFIALNCAAMPAALIESELFGHERGAFTGAHARSRGKFEIANRGTLFLDEIGDMDPATQAKLLRVLEEREFMRIGGDRSLHVDVRVIAATNANLEELVARGRFRRDLYYRLKVVTIRVPPLRERRQDIPFLVETFLEQLSKANAVHRKHISPEAVARLQAYGWPGNVRELKNLIESVLVSTPGDVIGVEQLPASLQTSTDRPVRPELAPGTTIEDMERELIRRTLEHVGGNRTHAATLLGIGVRTLQRKIRTYDIDIASRRRRPRRRRVLSSSR